MNVESFSFFLPMRSGSKRVKNKNTKPFSKSGKSLFQIKMDEIIKIQDLIDQVVISTNDKEVILQAESYQDYPKIKIDIRPDHLCLSTTKVQDLIDYVPTIIKSSHIFWLHVTAPFVDSDDYRQAIHDYEKLVLNGSHDSLMSVNKIQQFIWDEQNKKIINCDRTVNPWPNTQDLQPLYEINHAFYISSKENYQTLRDRIGLNPALYVLEGEKKIDIDWESDFKLAQKIYNSSK